MRRLYVFILILVPFFVMGQRQVKWAADGNSYFTMEAGEIIQYTLPGQQRKVLVTKNEMAPAGKDPLRVRAYYFSADANKVLLFTNSIKVWRLHTRGDYWTLDLNTKKLQQLGSSLPVSSLMFAKFSPDGTKVGYVSGHNVFAEDIASGKITQLTHDGSRKKINGTFDWAYEEEFSCRDGFIWSPDSKQISFWQIDATQIRDFYMINNTDSVYSRIIPVEYPTAGNAPSPAKIGVVDVTTSVIKWLSIPGDPRQHYLPRMEWRFPTSLFVQQLNRKQNESKIFDCNPSTGDVNLVFTENDKAWIDVLTPWENSYALDFRHTFRWINDGKEFLWESEKDGWRHLYRITIGGKETLITKGDYDVLHVLHIDEKTKYAYFYASPSNATQKYLYRTKLDGNGKSELVSPVAQAGTHSYQISPNGKFAYHSFNNANTRPSSEWVSLPSHKPLNATESIPTKSSSTGPLEFFQITTADGVNMDGWMIKPKNFDNAEKYPVLFYVYTEPWGAEVTDSFGVGKNNLFDGDLAEKGYIYIALDNRGTPAPKGREWRKSIYRKIGQINIQDQAAAAKEILKWPFVDAERIAVWGWSGGGAATLNLLFQYPEIYQTGIAVAAVSNQLTYDNIYQERFMGLPQENMEDFVKGSPLTHAKNLQGNLLYIHGTGDDNVHYANAEMLINELIKHKKLFQLMIYPNRTHGISEGEGTEEHLSAVYTDFLIRNCPPGGR